MEGRGGEELWKAVTLLPTYEMVVEKIAFEVGEYSARGCGSMRAIELQVGPYARMGETLSQVR